MIFNRQSEKYYQHDAKHFQLRIKQYRNNIKTHNNSSQQTSKNNKIRRKIFRFLKSTKYQNRQIIRQIRRQEIKFVQNVITHEQYLSIRIIRNHANSRRILLLIFA